MSSQNTMENTRGAEWRRWDPHLHAPGTLLSDQFGGKWEAYLQKIEQSDPAIEVLGVTDYFCINTYKEVRKRWQAGRLAGVKMLFPNVEMRLDVKTAKKQPLNLHLLFSPDDANHEAEIERLLGSLTFEFKGRKYRCTTPDLTALGRAFSGKEGPGALREGAKQFKITLDGLRELFRSEEWMRKNCLVAVAGGADGTSGLKDDDSFAAFRRELESFAHIIFAATPSQRDFWLGKKAGANPEFIEKMYGSLKPCLHGSDAHREDTVGSPDLERNCWLKGDTIFETLRQAVIEPEDRVWIGLSPPSGALPATCIGEIRTVNTPWLSNASILLNPGLVAIIGARGSGKTALADIIAAGAHSFGDLAGESSFLVRASSGVNYLSEASARLTWGDDEISEVSLSETRDDEAAAEAAYLSQHFVEKLCSSAGLARELREEMERVVFDATDPADRLGATSFAELSMMSLEPIRHRRSELQETISSISNQVVREDMLRQKLSKLKKDHQTLADQLAKSQKDLAALLPKGDAVRSKRLTALEQLCGQVEAKLEQLGRQRQVLTDLTSEIRHVADQTEPTRFREMKRRFGDARLTDAEWEAFRMVFSGKPTEVVQRAVDNVAAAMKRTVEGDPNSPIDSTKQPAADWPLNVLRALRDAAKKEVGTDIQKQKKFSAFQQVIARQEANLRRLALEIENAESATARRQKLIDARRSAYADVFVTITDELQVLERLYAPLRGNLLSAHGALAKLEFVVRRAVDLDAWIGAGERLLDLRKDTKFRGHGALRTLAKEYLLSAWQAGSADEVASAMDRFRSGFQAELVKAMPPTVTPDHEKQWVQELATWLYSTAHVTITYGISYDGVAIERLSPGTRGIVLLMLYLAVDRQDTRPLIIDQPEENLDPNSVFTELVPHFREARKRRQVIVVTHNANLVVNTDADQVIIAEAVRTSADSLPSISYQTGSLENSVIRKRVCEILEGGERAFLERERRYRLRWN